MEQQTDHISSLFEKGRSYVETRMEIVKLKAAEKSSEAISSLVSVMILFIFITLFVLLLSIGLALWLGDLLGNNYYGFFVVAGFYGVVALIIYLFKNKWIEEPVTNTIIKKMVKL